MHIPQLLLLVGYGRKSSCIVLKRLDGVAWQRHSGCIRHVENHENRRQSNSFDGKADGSQGEGFQRR